MNKLTSYLSRLTQQKARNKLTLTLDSLTQQATRMDSPQAGAYLMKIIITGIGSGTVIRSPSVDSYVNGQVVSLTAKAQAGSKFFRWTGDVTGSHFICNIRMDSDKLVVAEFVSSEYHENEKIASNFTVTSVYEIKNNNTRHSDQVVTDILPKDTLNDVKVLKYKDLPLKNIVIKGRFIDHEDGTVSDTRTRLMWMRAAVGQTINNNGYSGSAKRFHFAEAMAFRTEFAGHVDWRLPTIDELRELVDTIVYPGLDKDAFLVPLDSYFWSSTIQTSFDKEYANWPIIINLSDGTQGFGNPETDIERLRLVRDSDCFAMPHMKFQKIERSHTAEIINSLSKSEDSIRTIVLFPKDPPDKRIGYLGEFIDHGDDTVTDTRTDLMWMRYALGQTRNESAGSYSLERGSVLPSSFAKHDDWRLPNLDELKTLISKKYKTPTIDIVVFPDTPRSYFWTLSVDNAERRILWQVDFSDGKIYSNKSNVRAFIRLVRDGYKVTTSGIGSGTIHRTVDLPFGTSVVLTAKAAKGSKFMGWHGAKSGKNPVCVLTLGSAKTVVAEFVPVESFSLVVTTTGSGLGSVTRLPKTEKYVEGSTVKLTSCAANGSVFKGWDGDVNEVRDVCYVIMDSDKNLSAKFDQLIYFELNIKPIGSGSGIITCSPKAEKHLQGSAVTLTALPVKGSKFVGWQCDADGLSNSCSVIMDSAKTVKAEFAEIESFGLVFSTEGNGEGSIDWAIKSGQVVANYLEGVRCLEGSVVTLTAIASEGSTFRCWRGDASGSVPICKVGFDSEKKVVAEFIQLKSYGLYLNP